MKIVVSTIIKLLTNNEGERKRLRNSLRWIKNYFIFGANFIYMENVTLKKISEVLGLSISTISRALKDHPDISPQTKAKVRELANTLDYEPNANAINLRTRNNNVFGLMIPSANNSFYNSFLSSLEEDCRKNGYSLIIMQTADDPEVEKSILKLYRQNRVAGIFACLSPGTKDLDAYKKLDDMSIPVIFFDKIPDTDSFKVSVDDEKATIIAVNELLKAGKKNILGLFGNRQVSITKNRLKAFKQVLSEEKKVGFNIEFVVNASEAYETCYKYYAQNPAPDAIFCMSDEIMTGAMKALQQMKINYPDKTGIISISDGSLPNLYFPEITYVETSGHKLGKKTFECMISRINNLPYQKNNLVEPLLFKGGSL